jgi:NADH:ubiquinone oxidoreductase subunit 3 (subunit A)
MEFLLTPPLAFLIYIPLVFVLAWFGKALAGPSKTSDVKESPYSGGEEASAEKGTPGYRPFFLIAFFFAILHLGTLVVGLGDLTPRTVPYLVGLVLALIILLLG